ncbi:MAG: efflux RND transporter periplasmic adaptor subunit [Thermoanaerobaculales bacterium]|nr:efflux RND transporter periplasmic adaptor subunit [Thermoanaerobaculales bacterium]
MAALQDVSVLREFTGTTQAVKSVEITARVQGFLEQISFKPSTYVRKGQVLFVIEQAPYEARRDQAEANRKSAEAGLRRAESDLDRLEEAVKTNAVSQQEVTRARAERDQASAALLQAKAALTDAEIQLGYTTIKSPIDGLISRHLVDAGNLVGVGGSTLLATVRQIHPIHAYFDISERVFARMLGERGGHKPDADELVPATLILKETDLEVEGHLDSIDNTVDPETGTIIVRGVFPNADAKLFPGFFVVVKIPGKIIENAVLVEERAVGTDLAGKYLYLVGAEGIVEHRPVVLGSTLDDGKVVVAEGLKGSEQYILDGLLRARPGLPVTPVAGNSGD